MKNPFISVSNDRRFNLSPPDVIRKGQILLFMKLFSSGIKLLIVLFFVLMLGSGIKFGIYTFSTEKLREKQAVLGHIQQKIEHFGGRKGAEKLTDGQKVVAEWKESPAGYEVIGNVFETISFFRSFPLDYVGYKQKGRDITVKVAVVLDSNSPKSLQDAFYSMVEGMRSRGRTVNYEAWGNRTGLLVTVTNKIP